MADLTQRAVNIVAAKYQTPSVEQVQDIVEMVLLAAGEYEAAKHYILYRADRAKLRAERPIPDQVRATFAESDAYFPTQLQKFQYYDKYARFNYAHMRRETWIETVDRAVAFLRELSHDQLPDEDYVRLRNGILNMEAMPSMRLLAMAGSAARRSNITIYNCSYMPVDSLDAFVESLIISMSGCGVGYSVERRYVEELPRIQRRNDSPPVHFTVPDSADGWAEALRLGLVTWFDGSDVEFDYSEVRPAGAPLMTKGGRASGPEPLRVMLNFVRDRIRARQGSFLRPLDGHDIMCAVGGAAVSGGVRRTAMIALFDFDDNEMRQCKNAKNIVGNEQRWNANNSAVWPDRDLEPDGNQSLFAGNGRIGHRRAGHLQSARRDQYTSSASPSGRIWHQPMWRNRVTAFSILQFEHRCGAPGRRSGDAQGESGIGNLDRHDSVHGYPLSRAAQTVAREL